MKGKAGVCPTCQRVRPAAAKFCPHCGAAQTPPFGHNRVTVVLADRAGRRAEPQDPEEARGLVGQFYDLARRLVERCALPASNLPGSGMLAVFGLGDADREPPEYTGPVGPVQAATPADPGLRRLPIFAGCTAEELAPLAGAVQRRVYHRGHAVFREGDPATGVYLVERGRVKVSFTSADGKERTVALVGPGEILGEVPVLDGGVRSADGVAHEDCVVLFVPRGELVGWLREHPEAALRLIHLLGRRLQAMGLKVRDAAFLDVRGRLARALLELASGRGERGAEAGVLCPQIRQVELAHMVGATRESVNRWLRWFGRAGAVRREGDRIRVLNPERLRREIDRGQG